MKKHRTQGFEYANSLVYEIMRSNAKSMRYKMTPAENCLWQCLRAKQLGVAFRRQHIIGDYIADFVCLKRKLIIEVDGGIHSLGEQKEHDKMRDSELQTMGFNIIRFTNKQVINETENVLQTIQIHLNN